MHFSKYTLELNLNIIININKNDLSSTIIHDDNLLSPIINQKNALILYTSGTSGKPKGCVITYNAVQAHVNSMIKAWGWTTDDGKISFFLN